MQLPVYLSIIALIVSIISLGFSIYFNLRDRGKLVITSVFSQGNDYATSYLGIVVVNAGRRPVVIRMWVAADENGDWIGNQLGKHGQGLRLAEHEREEIILRKNDLPLQAPEHEIVPANIWAEDTLGRRYKVKDIKKNLKLFVAE